MDVKPVLSLARAWWMIYDALLASVIGLIVAVVSNSPRAAIMVVTVAALAGAALECLQSAARRRGTDLGQSD